MQHRLVRWIPAIVAPVVVAGVVAAPLVAAAAPPTLPTKSAQQVLELVAKSKDISGFTGTVSEHSNLGLPAVPSMGAGSGSSTATTLNLLAGDHTARVEVAGATRARIALLDQSAERDVVRNGTSTWLWDSKADTATHVVASGTTAPETQAPTTTPSALAPELLAKVGGTTSVAVDRTQRVAGRDAYTLVLTPKTSATTIGSVRIAVDAKTGLPLDVQVLARNASSPAFETGFTSIDFSTPAASRFDFTPPTGAKVTTKTVTGADHHSGSVPQSKRPTTTGSGWASIVQVPATDVPSNLTSNATVKRLTTKVAAGHLLSTDLVNVLITNDGRVLAGAVPASALEAAAG
ncbi:LolA family protein [Amnibacterium sp.]|uniref:LolA family protein n=1 Tax=Amnibacterium sp. TaxID=1872496 RepID=UPI003F7C9473